MQNAQSEICSTSVTNSLAEEGVLIDYEFDIASQSLRVFLKLDQFGFQKRHGYFIKQILFIVLIWPLLGSSSFFFYCGNRLPAYFSGGKVVLYEFLKRLNINWRGLRLDVAYQLIRQYGVQNENNACLLGSRLHHKTQAWTKSTRNQYSFRSHIKQKCNCHLVLIAGLAT